MFLPAQAGKCFSLSAAQLFQLVRITHIRLSEWVLRAGTGSSNGQPLFTQCSSAANVGWLNRSVPSPILLF